MPNLFIFKQLTPRQANTHALDLAASCFFGIGFGYFEALPGLVQSVLGGEGAAVNLLRIIRPGTLLLAFFWADMIRGTPKMPWIVWSRTIGALLLIAISFHLTTTTLLVGAGLFFFIVMGTIPALNAMYKENYPPELRFRLVANIRIVTSLAAAAAGLLISYYIKEDASAPDRLAHVTAIAGASGLFGVLIFRKIRIKSDGILRRRALSENYPVSVPLASSPDAIALPSGDDANGAERAANTLRRVLRGLKKLGTDTLFKRYMIAYFVFGFSAHLFTPALDLYLVQDLAISNEQIGHIYTTVPYLTSAVCMAFMGMLLDKMDVFAGRTLFTGVWFVCIALTGLSVFADDYALPLIYASRVVNGMALAGSTLLWAIGSTYFARDSQEAAEYQGVHSSLTGLRGLIGPTLSVAMIVQLGVSYGAMFALAAGGMILSGVMTYRLIDEARRDARFAEGAART